MSLSNTHPIPYLQDKLGETYIPIGPNLCFPRLIRHAEEGLDLYRKWMSKLAAAGGNYMRLWLGHPFLDPEPHACGCFNQERADRLIYLLNYAHARNIRVKLTIDHFRFILPQAVAEQFKGAATFGRPLYHLDRGGLFRDMDDYLGSEQGQRHFLKKMDWFAETVGDHPAVFAWELWNEMNAVSAENWREWTESMLPALRSRFPDTYILQSLGSFDSESAATKYRWYTRLQENDINQVHRYIDLNPGLLPVCHGPVDRMAASAVDDLRAMNPGKPILLSETGCVEPSHSAPFALYEKDVTGTILHDVLFAPFFAGASGPGQIWHWDLYLDRHDLWWHYAVFVRAIEGIDFSAEAFTTHRRETPAGFLYELRGRHTRLFWFRDAASDWRSELQEGREPILNTHYPFPQEINTVGREWAFLDPWDRAGVWQFLCVDGTSPELPPWRRSFLFRIRG